MHQIRPATLADMEPIIEMQRRFHADHLAWDPARWTIRMPMEAIYREWITTLTSAEADGLVLVATLDQMPAGYLIAEVESESAKHWSPRAIYLHDLFVNPSSRGAGVARALMEGLLQWSASNHPLLQLRLMTAFRNEAGRAFFERYGFRSCVVEMLREGDATR